MLLLKKLTESTRARSFTLKGGVNLRLFFGSPRYSEDVDLDLEPPAKQPVLRATSAILKGEWLERRLRTLGAEGVEYSGRPAKNTDTTVRIKLAVVNAGGIRLSTKIEMSLRRQLIGDEAVAEQAVDAVVRKYVPGEERPLVVAHYPRQAAIRQKIVALALRRTPQARDVFDLYVLARGSLASVDSAQLSRLLRPDELAEARTRAWGLTYREFSDQVLEFLSADDRATMAGDEHWETRQLFAVELIDAVLAQSQP